VKDYRLARGKEELDEWLRKTPAAEKCDGVEYRDDRGCEDGEEACCPTLMSWSNHREGIADKQPIFSRPTFNSLAWHHVSIPRTEVFFAFY